MVNRQKFKLGFEKIFIGSHIKLAKCGAEPARMNIRSDGALET